MSDKHGVDGQLLLRIELVIEMLIN